MQVSLINTTGHKIGTLRLPDEIFSVRAKPQLLAQAIRVYQGNRRQATAKVKTRGEVTGSGKKIWRQKGTGRARHGDRYAPIFVGGGVAHGPRGNQKFSRQLSKKLRRMALFTALSQRTSQGKLLVVEGFAALEPKTKLFSQAINKLRQGDETRVSIIHPEDQERLIRGTRNLRNVKLLSAKSLNADAVLRGGTLLLMKESLPSITQTFRSQGTQPTTPQLPERNAAEPKPNQAKPQSKTKPKPKRPSRRKTR